MPNLDGYFLTEDVWTVLRCAGRRRRPCRCSQAGTPTRLRASVTLRKDKPTAKGFTEEARKRFGDGAAAVLRLYPAGTDEEALESAAALASDLFIGHATWKWIEMHLQTGKAPVYRYSFDRKIRSRPTTP